MSIIYAMSDVHGFYEEMKNSLSLVDLDSNKDNKIIFLGDYIDRGTKSCQVLYYIKELEEKYPKQVVILIGNHDQMFIDWYAEEDCLQWLSHDPQLLTTKSFLTEEQFTYLTKEFILQEPSYKRLSVFIKDMIKNNHSDLLNWLTLKKSPLYYESSNQIFVHAGIFEVGEELWKIATEKDEFIWKFPAETGYFYKDIIAGHISSATVSNDENFLGKVYWDKQSHYFIDGEIEKSGVIPLLKYDTETLVYSSFELKHNGKWTEYNIQ